MLMFGNFSITSDRIFLVWSYNRLSYRFCWNDNCLISNILKITVDVNIASMFSKTISYLILVVFFACTTKYTINKIEISEID